MFAERKLTRLVTVVIFICMANALCHSKSVFVANHGLDGISAYGVNGDQVDFKANLSLPQNGFGPIDVAIDPASGILLVTNENDGNYTLHLIVILKIENYIAEI